LVKTTPKPSATKKSRGELVGPLPPPPPDGALVAGATEAVVDDIMSCEMVPYVRVDGRGRDEGPCRGYLQKVRPTAVDGNANGCSRTGPAARSQRRFFVG